MADSTGASARVRCPRCESRLDVLETSSGGRSVSIIWFGPTVEASARSLETFKGPGEGGDIKCPACHTDFDPSAPGGIARLRRMT
jgi:hypothetical protein